MASPTFNTGHDAVIVMQGPFGQVTLNTTEFKWQDEPHEVVSRPLNRKTQTSYIPDRTKGSFMVDRNNATMETLMSSQKAIYYSGGVIPVGAVFVYITNIDQSQTRVQINDCVFKVTNAGTYKQDDVTKQEIEFTGSDMAVF